MPVCSAPLSISSCTSLGLRVFFPAALLTMGAGYMYERAYGIIGIFIAVVVVSIGAAGGSILCFTLGRTVLRETVERFAKRSAVFGAIDPVIRRQGLKLVFLMRLSPFVPFTPSSYLYGVSSVTFRDYAISCFGFLPGTVAFVLLGSTLGSLTDAADSQQEPNVGFLVFSLIGTLSALGGAIYVSRLAKAAVNKIFIEETGDHEKSEGLSGV